MLLKHPINCTENGEVLVQISKAPDELAEYLTSKITEEAVSRTGLNKVSNFGLEIRNEEQILIGGLSGYEFYGSFVIDILWVHPKYRRQGIGSLLLDNLDEVAKQKKMKFISVSTMEWWDCLNYYQQKGFILEFVREGFDNGFKQYHLIKYL